MKIKKGSFYTSKYSGKVYRVTQSEEGRTRLLWNSYGPARAGITGTWVLNSRLNKSYWEGKGIPEGQKTLKEIGGFKNIEDL